MAKPGKPIRVIEVLALTAISVIVLVVLLPKCERSQASAHPLPARVQPPETPSR